MCNLKPSILKILNVLYSLNWLYGLIGIVLLFFNLLRFGIEGPVYLSPRGEKESCWEMDEVHQTLFNTGTGVKYHLLQTVRIHLEVVERQANRPKLELTLL